MNVTFILLGIIGVVYGTLLVGIEFRKWRARIHCRVPVDAVFEKTVTKKMGDRVRTYALFSYHYQEKKFRQCTMERITRKEKKSLEKGKIYTIRINEENPKKLCYLRKNFQMEDLLTFICRNRIFVYNRDKGTLTCYRVIVTGYKITDLSEGREVCYDKNIEAAREK